MNKLSAGQKKVAAEITGNIAVAWFTAGVISPFFTQPKNFLVFVFTFAIALFMTGVFSVIALDFVQKIKI